MKYLLSGVQFDNSDVVPRHPVGQLAKPLVGQLWPRSVSNFPSLQTHLKRRPKIFVGNPGNRRALWRRRWSFLVFNLTSFSTFFSLFGLFRSLLLEHALSLWKRSPFSPESEFCICHGRPPWGQWWCPLLGCNLGKRSRQEQSQGTPWNIQIQKDLHFSN